MQSYTKAGDFTVKGKLKSALIDNAIYYGSYLLIAAILLIYLAAQPDFQFDWYTLAPFVPLNPVMTLMLTYYTGQN